MFANGQNIIIFTEPQLESLINKAIEKSKSTFIKINQKKSVKKLLTKDDVVSEYGLTLGTLNKLVSDKKIEYVKPNNKIFFTREAVENYIEKHTQKVEEPK